MLLYLFFIACTLTSFKNGDFETGNSQGWTIGGGYRASIYTDELVPATYLPDGANYDPVVASTHSSIVTSGSDPILGNLMPNIVHGGSYSWRIEDLDVNSYLSVISQQITNYFCLDIYFSWLAVLENGDHLSNESSALIIDLKDTTVGDTVLSRLYDAGAGSTGIDSRFQQLGDYFYTPNWQVEHFSVDNTRIGHNFTLNILAADCIYGGHRGYVYLDDFGGVNPNKK